MAPHTSQENDTAFVKSKYFSLETYFKTPTNVNKRIKPSISDLQVEEAIKEQEEKKEQCPLCRLWILTESISMEVHVNQCLDKEQEREKENIPPGFMSFKEKFSYSNNKNDSFRKDNSFSIESSVKRCLEDETEETEENNSNSCNTNSLDTDCNDSESSFFDKNVDNKKNQVAKCDTKITNASSVQPSSWRSMFSSTSSSTLTTKILGVKDVNASVSTKSLLSTTNQKKKCKPCPFYKRVRGKYYLINRIRIPLKNIF